ncbi:MAG: dihydroorotase, partial [Candidatus Margulisiibacteriota bacterium]
MIESLLLKKVEMVLDRGIFRGDIYVKNGRIVEVGPSLSHPAEVVLEEPHWTVLPGVIDAHVHFREPGATWKEDIASGSRSAAAGGVTSFLDMPNNTPSATTTAQIAYKKQIASENSLINYNFFIGATPDNLADLNACPNIAGIKIFMGSSTGTLLVDDPAILDMIFKNGRRLIAVHAEDEAMIRENKGHFPDTDDPHLHYRIRSPEAALKATQLAVALADQYQRRLHICHLSTADEAAFLRTHKPPWVTTEVSPQHLCLSADDYDRLGNKIKINPPIRTRDHRDALWTALLDGTIDFVATDHAPHTLEEKAKPYSQAPSGMPGVETMVSLMLTLVAQKKCTLAQVTHWLSAAPAKAYGMVRKGGIHPGNDADLTIVDLHKQATLTAERLHSKCGWTAFEGQQVTGMPVLT